MLDPLTNLETELLSRAVENFARMTRLKVTAISSRLKGFDGTLRLTGKELRAEFTVEISSRSPRTITFYEELATRTPFPLTVVLPRVPALLADQLRERDISYMDEAGNAYLKAPGIFVYIVGQRATISTLTTGTPITSSVMKAIFALLQNPDLISLPYRDIADSAEIALGSVSKTFIYLEQNGYVQESHGMRHLRNIEKLQEEWASLYPKALRSKLLVTRFQSPDPLWWQDADLRPEQAQWGGEVAAAKLTKYLKPATFTLYVRDLPRDLIASNRLRHNPKGDIEILTRFWSALQPIRRPPVAPDVVPPLVAYADLLTSSSTRNLEAANILRERYLNVT